MDISSNTTLGRVSFILDMNLSGDTNMVNISAYSVGCHCVFGGRGVHVIQLINFSFMASPLHITLKKIPKWLSCFFCKYVSIDLSKINTFFCFNHNISTKL